MKVKELQKKLLKEKIGGIIIFSQDPNFFYFMQQEVDNSFLIIPAKGKPTVFTNRLDKIKTSFKKVTYQEPHKELKQYLEKNKIKVLGINEGSVVVKRKKKLSKLVKTEDVEEILIELRRTKTKAEIDLIRKACRLSESVLKKVVKNFNFKTEKEIVRFIQNEAINNDTELSFDTKVASGINAATPHHSNNTKLKKGFLIIDMGLKYKGYCSDITRTLYLGTPSKKELDIYNNLLRIQKNTIKKVKAGIKAKELDAYVREKLGSEAKYFVHAVGHGMGIKIHEDPRVSSNSEDVLEEGNVITIEPGLYKDFGIRIEDDIFVTRRGCRLLTKFPKELVIITKK
ncbi:M24 family metallopeptidase [Bacteroidota bacterium]